MANGDSFLGAIKDAVNSVPILGTYTRNIWGQGNYNPQPLPQNPSFMDRVNDFSQGALPVLKDVNTAVSWASDNVAPLKFVLDLPNKTADSVFNGLESVQEGDSFTSGWAKSWDSYGQADHVSAGEIIGGNINNAVQGNFTGNLNIGTTQGIQQLHSMAHGTWYGDIAGGVSDLLAGFIGPGTVAGGVVKGVRAAGEVATFAEANAAADAFNAAHAAGKLDELKKGTAFFTPKSGQTLAARMHETAQDILAHASSPSDLMDHIAPRMEGANENTKRIITSIGHQAWKMGPEESEHVLVNAWFAAMGSDAAKAELIRVAPKIANSIAEASAPPSFLGDVATAQKMMLDAHLAGGDYRPGIIMDQVFNTPRKIALRKAIGDEMDKAKDDAIRMKGLRQQLYDLKPVQRVKNPDGTYTDNFDTARLKEARDNAHRQVLKLQDKLTQAQADLKGTQRFAGAADKKVLKEGVSSLDENPYKNAKEFNQALGSAQQRVDSLTEQINQARADRELLRQTPLHDPDAMDQFRAQMAGARQGTKEAMLRRDTLQAMYRVSGRQIRDDIAEMNAIRPGLNMTNQFLADIDKLGEQDASFVGRVSPTMLDAAKAGMREHIGRTYLYDTGDPYTPSAFWHVLPTPSKQLANIGTEYGLNRVQTLDRYRGSQELRMSLKRSGEYTGDEIKAASDRFIQASPNDVQQVVSEIQDEMLARIARSEGLEPETAHKIISQTNLAMGGVRAHLALELQKSMDDGQKVVKLHEFPNDDSSDAIHVISAATIRSHLSDTTSFLDPHHARRLMKMENGPGINWSKFIESADGAQYIINFAWKVAALMRPGLFFRNMLDTGIRSMALMGVTGSMMSAVNGTVHKIRNDGMKVADWSIRPGTIRGDILERIGLHQPENYAMRIMGDKGTTFDIGKGRTANVSLFDRTANNRVTPESLAATRSAEQRGAFVHNSLFGAQEKITNQIHKQYAVWDKYSPDHKLWPEAYAEHLGVLMASPTVRAILKDVRIPAPPGGISAEERINRLFSDPAVRAEYNDLGLPNNASRYQFVEQLDHELELMLPENRLIGDVLDGKVQGPRGEQWIKENFPQGMRFQIPGPMSVLERGPDAFKNLAKGFTEKAFSVLMDEPDFWLVRHPVAVRVFGQQVKQEAAALMQARRAKFGDDAEITSDDIRKITARARTKAITTVRNYGYDTTHNSVFSQHMHRVAPFYNVFHDVLRAYSKLIYDDPQRLHLLSGLYNAPANISQWMPNPIFVDGNGNPLRPGEEPKDGRKMITYGKLPFGGVTLRTSLSSLNAILMSEVPWLPGWGPIAQVPVTAYFNSNKELGLRLSNSTNPVVQDLMKSFYPGGTIPKGDPGSLLKAFAPPVWRRVIDGYQGDTFWKNVQYGVNQAYINAEKNGEKFDYDAALDKAKSDANMANTIMLVSQGVFGLSGDTSVEGQFYVTQMHELQALTPAQLKQRGYPSAQAAFSAMFPEASNLDWSFRQNDTGISATFRAQDSALHNQALIAKYPALGWFIVGGENVANAQDVYSQTAYNQQQMTGGRTTLDPQALQDATRAGQGWQEYTQYMTAVNQLAQQYNLSDKTVLALKEMMVFGQQAGGAPGDRVIIMPGSLAARNPQWYRAYNVQQDNMANFYNEADQLANSPQLRNRQDMAMYRQYRAAQAALMNQAGLKDLGTGYASAAVRYVLNGIGAQMASQNVGFEQMWNRMLSKDVQPRPTDSRFNFAPSS